MKARAPVRILSPLDAALHACRRHIIFAGVFSALLNLLYLAPTLYMLQVYDRVVPTRGRLTLLMLTLVLVVSLTALALLDLARSRILVRASVRLERRLAGVVLDAGFSRASGARDVLVSRSMRELDTLRQVLSGPLILALFDAPWSPVYILVSFMIQPVLGYLSIFGACVLLGLTWLNDIATRQRLRQANEAASASYLSQQYSTASAELIRALGMRRAMVTRHLEERRTAASLQLTANLAAGGLNSVSRFFRLAFQSLALGLGAYLAIEQKVSGGAIFAASLLAGRALAPIDQLLGAWRGLGQANEAYRNLRELLPAGTEPAPPTELPSPTGAVSVEAVSVASPGGNLVLRDVTFAVAAGETIGLIGPSGAGKSTLARVIAGALQPDRGVVRFDGADFGQWDPERLGRYVGYMPQETALFAGSVKQNIARFNDLTDESDEADIDAKTVEAARLAGAHAMILRLPKGYDTILGWGGRGLSAGHAQRIALARALYGSPKLLVLDEPNAHLDAEGDAVLAEALIELKRRGSTVLLVAHRTGILSAVDKLMMLRDGRLELFGPRDDVVRRLSSAQAPRNVAPQPAQGAGGA